MQQMIQQGATIIFPTSFGHLDPALNVAKKNPKVTFFHEGGLKSSDNLGTFFGTIWQTEYLAGMAAGSASKSGKLGFVVAFPISQTLLNINAFHLGARAVNPNATTTVVFTGNWCDPAKNAEATQSLVSQGIDVITQHQDCPVPVIQAAEKAGVMSVGYHVDDQKFAPKGLANGRYVGLDQALPRPRQPGDGRHLQACRPALLPQGRRRRPGALRTQRAEGRPGQDCRGENEDERRPILRLHRVRSRTRVAR